MSLGLPSSNICHSDDSLFIYFKSKVDSFTGTFDNNFFFPQQDVEYIETVYEKMFKLVERGGDKKLKPEYDCVCKIRNLLNEEKKQIRFADWDTKEVSVVADSDGK